MRVFVGIFFAVMAFGVHGMFILTNPNSYVEYARLAYIPLYRDIAVAITQFSPLAFGLAMLAFEALVAALILSHGGYVKLGLLAGILFLVGITPLPMAWPNAILAIGLLYLMTETFQTSVVASLGPWLHSHRPIMRHSQA